MQEYGITTLQTKPSLFKNMTISKIVDKRKQKDIGYFISARYEDMIRDRKKGEVGETEQVKKASGYRVFRSWC